MHPKDTQKSTQKQQCLKAICLLSSKYMAVKKYFVDWEQTRPCFYFVFSFRTMILKHEDLFYWIKEMRFVSVQSSFLLSSGASAVAESHQTQGR